MKLLFDQNVSYRLLKELPSIYKGSAQVRLLDLYNATDIEIWDFDPKMISQE